MAVPKKKTSKSKRNFRRHIWNKKVLKSLRKAISFYKSRSKEKLINSFAL